MNKKHITATICIQTTCLCVIVWILTANSVTSVKAHVAYQEPTATPTLTPTPTPTTVPPFLGPVYYDEEYIWQIFDHQLPGDYDSVLFPWVMHYDATLHNPPASGYGYDGHIGIDYSLVYEPVLASADGTVEVAGWSNESNHRLGYGLHVVMSYEANANYTTIYGHLSTLNVETGDEIDVDPNDPGNRNRIIGISGNTGHVFNDSGNDCTPIPDSGPNCGQHLHFETRRNGIWVNPYGWISSTPDPWAQHQDGTDSYYLWANRPAVLSTQYQASGPQGTPVDKPAVNNARMIIDDASADFVTTAPVPPCTWNVTSGDNSAYNSFYHRIVSDASPECTATWFIRGDAFTPAGEYDLFVHIPNDVDASLGVEYTVQHNGESDVAVIVQAAYLGNNTEHDAWAYLGRYDFAMDSLTNEYVRLDAQTIIADPGTYVLADAIMLAPAFAAVTPQRYVYVSFAGNGTAGNVSYSDEDILLFDAETSEWRMFFDGSDVGLSSLNVDAAEYRNGDIYFSVDQAFGSSYTDSDIIRFNPTSLGDDTSGSMTLALAGSPYLTKPGEDVDALSFMANGHYLLSTIDEFDVPNVNLHDDEDIFSAAPSATPTYSAYLDGSMIGLGSSAEDVDALWLDTKGDMRYLSTEGSFSVSGSSGDGADVIRCQPGIISTCAFVAGLFWNGSAHGIANMGIDALYLGGYIPLPGECGNLPLNCSFEEQFVNWTVDVTNPANEKWITSTSEYHSGWYSALAEATHPDTGTADLLSSPITIESMGVEYRFSFYAKGVSSSSGEMEIRGIIHWYRDDQPLGLDTIVTGGNVPINWTLFTNVFICPPHTANKAIFVLDIGSPGLQRPSADFETNDEPERIFVDDVKVESRLNGSCPTLNSGGD